jgi:hypothetical protein
LVTDFKVSEEPRRNNGGETHNAGLEIDFEVVLQSLLTSPLELGRVVNQSLRHLRSVIGNVFLLRNHNNLAFKAILSGQYPAHKGLMRLTILKLSTV